MASRFWRSGGNGLQSHFLANVASSTTWNSVTSSNLWTLSNSNKTGTCSVSSGDADLFATNAKTSGTYSVTVTLAAADIYIGLSQTVFSPPTTWLGGATGGVAVMDATNGLVWLNGATSAGATYTTGDVITVSWDGSTVTFKKNGVTAGSCALSGAAYPAISTNGNGNSVVADFTGW